MIEDITKKVVDVIGTLTTLRIVEENTSAKPPVTEEYLRVTTLPTEPIQVTIGRNRILRERGIIQVDFIGLPNSGINKSVVNSIVDCFNTNRFYTTTNGDTFTIMHCWRLQGVVSNDRYIIPIQLRYEYYS